MERGEIVWVDFHPTRGNEINKVRQAIILQHNVLNKYNSTTIVVPLTSKIYSTLYPTHVIVEGYGLKQKSTIKVDQIRTIDKNRITGTIGKVSPKIMKQIGLALQYTLDYY